MKSISLYLKYLLLLLALGGMCSCEKYELRKEQRAKSVQSHLYISEGFDMPNQITHQDIVNICQQLINENPQYDSLYINKLPPDGEPSTYTVVGHVRFIFHFWSVKATNNTSINIQYDSTNYDLTNLGRMHDD